MSKKLSSEIAHEAPSGQWWYDLDDFFYGIDFTEDADFAAECSPQTILKLIAVARAAKSAELGWKKGSDVYGPMYALREALEALE